MQPRYVIKVKLAGFVLLAYSILRWTGIVTEILILETHCDRADIDSGLNDRPRPCLGICALIKP